jgi:hypothetical protein
MNDKIWIFVEIAGFVAIYLISRYLCKRDNNEWFKDDN